MANLEEGIVKHWSWNRLVLVGDACHKFTPNYGLGYNNGIQDVVALVNELHQVVTLNRPGNGTPSLGTLRGALSRYQAARMGSLQGDYNSSANLTRMSAWRNWMYRLFDRYPLSRGSKDAVEVRHFEVGFGHLVRTFVYEDPGAVVTDKALDRDIGAMALDRITLFKAGLTRKFTPQGPLLREIRLLLVYI
ncbi:hypothetical protein CHU98_g8884 [Xylaria longipes]|nr:hypothetical protein CHU98_g8884 [Xylaria longipes]